MGNEHQQQQDTDPAVYPEDPKERQRQTDLRTKRYKDTMLPDWEYEALLRVSANHARWLKEMLARSDLDPVEREAIQKLASDLPPDDYN